MDTVSSLRQKWSAGQACYGIWSSLPGAVTAELVARTNTDYVVIDLQHGAATEADLPAMTSAITSAGSVPLVRTRSASFADVGRPLDLGAQGVIVPSVRDAEHAREIVAACQYAPQGHRSIGRLSGGSDWPLVIIMVETASALDDLAAILAVDGMHGIYVGPGDLSLALGLGSADRRLELRSVLSSIITRAVDAGVPVGVHAYNGTDAARFAAEGATIVTATADVTCLTAGLAEHLESARA